MHYSETIETLIVLIKIGCSVLFLNKFAINKKLENYIVKHCRNWNSEATDLQIYIQLLVNTWKLYLYFSLFY